MYKSGGCNCNAVRFRLLREPVFTHICHCKQCQRSSGGAFNVSTVVLVEDFEFDDCTPDTHHVSGPTGIEYEAWGCDNCGCTIGGKSVAPTELMVVRPGTLDDTTGIEPKAHIWTREKQDWVEIPEGMPAFEENYDPKQVWPQSSLDRLSED